VRWRSWKDCRFRPCTRRKTLHGKKGLKPYRPAAACLSWSLGRGRGAIIAGVIRKGLKLAFKALVYFHVWFIGVTFISVAVFAFIDPAATTLSLSRKYIDGWRILKPIPVRLESVPLTARRMLVAVEDYKFWTHNGIDFEAFGRAVEINRKIGRPMYGGSTLTMQTARTLFLVPVKSYVRKYLEVIVAFELELLLPKRRILELYFSWAEWGKGVFGIESASRLYYGASVSKLDGARIAKLISILSSPIRYTPSTFAKSGLLRFRYEFLEERYLR
jgi:monofunctional glycosyltransferase